MAQIFRATDPCEGAMGYHSHDLDFQMNYLIKGWARIYLEDIGEIRVEEGDVWYQVPNVKHDVLEFSDDFEVLEITMPADFPTRDESREGVSRNLHRFHRIRTRLPICFYLESSINFNIYWIQG